MDPLFCDQVQRMADFMMPLSSEDQKQYYEEAGSKTAIRRKSVIVFGREIGQRAYAAAYSEQPGVNPSGYKSLGIKHEASQTVLVSPLGQASLDSRQVRDYLAKSVDEKERREE